MFTGLVQAVGIVRKLERASRGPDAPVRLTIDPGSWDHRARHGDSISVCGVCLTVDNRPAARSRSLEFVAIPETLSRTTLGGLRTGSPVNLEHAVTPTTLLGGHLVQGHVDGLATVASVRRGDDWRVRLRLPADLREFIMPKGSVCLNGVSLTIARVYPDGFEVALIPTTLKLTTLEALQPGDGANIEVDMVVKTILTWAQRSASRGRPTASKRKASSRPSPSPRSRR